MNVIKSVISFINKHIATIAVWIIIVIVAWTNYNLKFWKVSDRVIIWDVKSYYIYLPATFIYHDLSLKFSETESEKLGEIIFQQEGPKGYLVIQTTYGQALLYAPFFLAAHGIQVLTGGDTSGYSGPYKISLLLSCMFYLAIGLHYLKKFLLKYFSSWATAITLTVIVLGTNLFYYSTQEAPMTHAYNFSIIAVFLYFMTKWYEKQNVLNSMMIGLLVGLITLIRPVNLIVVLFFGLWEIRSWQSFKERVVFLLKSYKWILLMMAFAFLLWIPQFLYWKFISGNFLYYTYSDQRFFFNNPQIISSLFSYRKGLFLYIPLTAIAIIGIPLLYKKYPGLIFPVGFLIALNIYILSSWCFWWFGGSFGPRSYIDTYAILAIPFAALTSWILARKIPWIVLFVLVTGTLIKFNFFQSRQYMYGSINWSGMTKEAYWKSFLHIHPTKEYYDLLRFPNRDNAVKGIYYKDDLTYDEVMAPYTRKENPGLNNKDSLDKRANFVRQFIIDVNRNPSWHKVFDAKAEKLKIPVDTVIRHDANWFYDQELKKQADSLSSKDDN